MSLKEYRSSPQGNVSSPFSEGYIFARDRITGSPFVVYTAPDRLGIREQRDFKFTFRINDNEAKENVLGTFRRAQEQYNFYRKQRLCVTKKGIEFLPLITMTWNDIFLAPNIIKEIDTNIIGYFNKMNEWKELGLPLTRSILLSGKPGVGKTLIGKVLADQLEGITFIWVTGESQEAPEKIFAFARSNTPCILFFEDLDFIGQSRFVMSSSALAELLSQLDGFRENTHIVVVATTNNPEALDEALIDRPGRFDRHVCIKPPDESLRRKILMKYLGKVFIEEEETVLRDITMSTDGFTGAHLREVAFGTKIEAVNNGRPVTNGTIHIKHEDFEKSIDALKKVRPELGFMTKIPHEKINGETPKRTFPGGEAGSGKLQRD